MDAIKLLFSSDVGLLSVFTIVGASVVVVFLYGWIKGKMAEDAKNAK